MNLAITVLRWFLAKYPHLAAITLQECRVRKERARILAKARELNREMGRANPPGLRG